MKVGLGLLVVLVLECSTACLGAGAKNIFDDDWTPPKKSEARPPRTVKPPTPPAQTPPKSTPMTNVPSKATPEKVTPEKVTPATPAAPRPAARLPVPGKAEQAAVRKVMKEVFAEQLADRSIAARRKLTAALMGQVEKSADAPTDQFVLLAAAIDAAEEGVDLPAACAAADRMAEIFDVDGLGVKAAAAIKMGPRSGVPDAAAENVESALELSRDLARENDYATAARVCGALQPASARDAGLRQQLQQRQHELVIEREMAERFERDLARLKDAPNDPSANLSAGRYACLVRGEWESGLVMLARGSDASLKSIASRELAPSKNPTEVGAIADAWWDLASKQVDPASRAAMSSHSAKLYKQVVDQVSGLRRAQIENRLAEFARSSLRRPGQSGRVIDLLKLIDVTRDKVEGTWTRSATTPGSIESPSKGNARIAIRYQPPEEYDYHIEFTRLSGQAKMHQIFTHANHRCTMVVAWEHVRGFETIGGKDANVNVTSVRDAAIPEIGRRYSSVVKVRRDGIKAYLDGDLVAEYKTDGSDLAVKKEWSIGDRFLGLGTSGSQIKFQLIEIHEISGRGKYIP